MITAEQIQGGKVYRVTFAGGATATIDSPFPSPIRTVGIIATLYGSATAALTPVTLVSDDGTSVILKGQVAATSIWNVILIPGGQETVAVTGA